MKSGAPKNKETAVFVDAIEAESARLLLGEAAFDIPAQLLPPSAREGSWVRILVQVTPAPPGDKTEALRRKLGRGDPGGDIKL